MRILRYVFLIIFFIVLYLNASFSSDSWVIDGNIVSINDTNVFISITPHTISSSGYITINLTSKVYTGNIDAIFGVNSNTIKPSKVEVYKPKWENETKSYECTGEGIWFNYTTIPKYAWCWKNLTIYAVDNTTIIDNKVENIFQHYFDYGNLAQKTIYWNETKYTEWQDFSSNFQKQNYNYGGMNVWYYATNIPITQNKNYKLRAYINLLPKQGDNNGKYWFAIKPSQETLQESISNNHMYFLDPWFNSSYGRKKQINISENSNSHQTNYTVRLNVTYDSDMQTDFDDLRFLNGSENTELSYWIEEKYNSNHAMVWVKVPILTANTNTSIYMYYNNSAVTTTSNGENTFFLFDNYTDNSNIAKNTTSGTGYIDISNGNLNIYSNGTSNKAWLNYSGVKNIPYYVAIKLLNVSIDAPSQNAGQEWIVPLDANESGGGFFVWRTLNDFPSATIFTNFPTNWYKATPSRPIITSYASLINRTLFIYENYILNVTNATRDPVNISNNFQVGNALADNFQGGNMTIDWMFVTYNWTYPEPSYTFGPEEEYPIITLSLPSNNTGDSDGNITFIYNVTDNTGGIINCSLFINNAINQTNTSITKNIFQNFTLTNQAGSSLTWYVNCVDSSLYPGTSEIRNLYIILSTEFSGNTTDLRNVNITNITNLVLEVPSVGMINFTQNVDLSNETSLDPNVNISLYSIEILTNTSSALNKSADITFYNVTFNNPRILLGGTVCEKTTCQSKSYLNNIYIFNVTHFTKYSVEETPTTTGTQSGPSGNVAIIKALALIKHQNDTRFDYTDRQRAILYSVIKSYQNIYGTGDKLLDNQTKELIIISENKEIKLTEEQLEMWYEQFINNQIEEIDVDSRDIEKFSLIEPIKIEILELKLDPQRLTTWWFYPYPSKKFIWNVKATQDIKSCEIIKKNKLNLECNIKNKSIAEISYYEDEITEIYTELYTELNGEALFESELGSISYLPISIRVYNLKYNLFGMIPLLILSPIVIIIAITSFFIIKKRKDKNGSNE